MQLFLIAGWLADRFNVCWILAAGFFLWSGATAVTGATRTFAMMFALRLVLGVGESIAYPSYSRIMANYFPEHHRGMANAVIDAGTKLGPAMGTLLGGFLMASLRVARLLHWSRRGQFDLADSLDLVDAARPRRRDARASGGYAHRGSDPAPARRNFQRARPVLLELFLVFPANVAAVLLAERAPFQRRQNGDHGGLRLFPDRVFHHDSGTSFRPMDRARRLGQPRSQDFRRHRSHVIHDHTSGGDRPRCGRPPRFFF